MPMTDATIHRGGGRSEPALRPGRTITGRPPTIHRSLGHHSFDSALRLRRVRRREAALVEGSLFNGREPDADGRVWTLDSFSGRLDARPSREWDCHRRPPQGSRLGRRHVARRFRIQDPAGWPCRRSPPPSAGTTRHGDRSLFVGIAPVRTLYGRPGRSVPVAAEPAAGDAAGLKTPVLALTLGGVRARLARLRRIGDVVLASRNAAANNRTGLVHVFFRARPAGSMDGCGHADVTGGPPG
jgi:hypothetical protein